MDELAVETVADIEREPTVLLEGLPGVGHVGKLAAEHLIEEGDSQRVRRLCSTHLPPQVTVDDDGTTELVGIDFHSVTIDETTLLVVTGDHQAGTNGGHYAIAEELLAIATDAGVERAYGLGGVPTGDLGGDRSVLGAVNDAAIRPGLEDAGVTFREGEPEGGIVGVSGLMLGLGSRRDLPAACLMGETSGYLVDPKSARAVIETLETVLDIGVDYEALDDRAEEMEEVVSRMDEMEASAEMAEENLRYIG
jgi:uncharacterized protein (TIGR00162 family)